MKAPAPRTAVRCLGSSFCLAGLSGWFLIAVLAVPRVTAADLPPSWIGTWSTAPRSEAATTDQTPLQDATLRQVVRVSVGGRQLRVRFSNVFGATPLVLDGVHVATAGPAGSIQPGTDRVLRFGGETRASIPSGACLLSDPLDFELAPLADVAVSIYLKGVPAMLTMHHGSRATSYLQRGDALSAPALPDAAKIVHWYFLDGLEVRTAGPAASIVVLGDSITDGYGCTTDRNNRWTDALARRLQASPATRHIGVLNEGIGGNALVSGGLGPIALARFGRDVIGQAGVRWLIVLEGINDLGGRVSARAKNRTYASAPDIIQAYDRMIETAHAHGIRAIGATVLPDGGATSYWSEDGEADRQQINAWIRTRGHFDAVIDFDAALRDEKDPTRLAAPFDSGDHLHPSLAGYERMAESVDLGLFAP